MGVHSSSAASAALAAFAPLLRPTSSRACLSGGRGLDLVSPLRAISSPPIEPPSCPHSSALTRRSMVSLHGGGARLSPGTHVAPSVRPPDPASTCPSLVEAGVEELLDWFSTKRSVLCLTGAGLSTESGIPDYRGHNGSYRRNHKPIVHDQFMRSESNRKRYWGRSMVGWTAFADSYPSAGHLALASLERSGHIGVHFDDSPEYYRPDDEDYRWTTSTGTRTVSILTQNVDRLHKKAGSVHVTELHGRGDVLKCMSCGSHHCRREFHRQLEEANRGWVETVTQAETEAGDLRPDGDGHVAEGASYENVRVPACSCCGTGFLKPDVVFFGDTVPRHRVDRCYAAVAAADGLLCVGSSLAVHSAFRFVQAAANAGTPIAVLNVGETRAETSRLPGVTKIECPAGATLSAVAAVLSGALLDDVDEEKVAVCDR